MSCTTLSLLHGARVIMIPKPSNNSRERKKLYTQFIYKFGYKIAKKILHFKIALFRVYLKNVSFSIRKINVIHQINMLICKTEIIMANNAKKVFDKVVFIKNKNLMNKRIFSAW